jgi:hypothetical protein
MNESVPVDREVRPDTDVHSVGDTRAAADARLAAEAEKPVALFHEEESRGYRTRWDGIQTGFVDQPKAAVEQADALVGEMLKRLTDTFAAERSTLESQWSRGQEVSTEDLRIALKRYRSFFERLLTI